MQTNGENMAEQTNMPTGEPDSSYPDSWKPRGARGGRNSAIGELQRGAEDWLAALSQNEFDDVVARTRQPKGA